MSKKILILAAVLSIAIIGQGLLAPRLRQGVSQQHLDNLRRKDSLRGTEIADLSVRLGNYSASHFEGSAVPPQVDRPVLCHGWDGVISLIPITHLREARSQGEGINEAAPPSQGWEHCFDDTTYGADTVLTPKGCRHGP